MISLALKMKTIVAILAAGTLLGAGASIPASAVPASNRAHPIRDGAIITPAEMESIFPGGSQLTDPQYFLNGLRELESSGIAKEDIAQQNVRAYRYTVPEGSFSLPRSIDVESELQARAASPGAGAQTRIEVLTRGIQMAIGFNSTDQSVLGSAIGSTAITAAVCAIPVVGTAACVIVGAVVTVVTGYILANGACSNNRVLWWYDVKGGSTVQCRSSRPW